jgi:hypothetical protein
VESGFVGAAAVFLPYVGSVALFREIRLALSDAGAAPPDQVNDVLHPHGLATIRGPTALVTRARSSS